MILTGHALCILAKKYNHQKRSRRDGVVVRASALQWVDLGFVLQVKSYQKTSKNGIYSFPARRSAHRDNVKNKPVSLLFVSLGMALDGMPPSSCCRQVAGPSSLPVVVAQSDETCKPSMSSYA